MTMLKKLALCLRGGRAEMRFLTHQTALSVGRCFANRNCILFSCAPLSQRHGMSLLAPEDRSYSVEKRETKERPKRSLILCLCSSAASVRSKQRAVKRANRAGNRQRRSQECQRLFIRRRIIRILFITSKDRYRQKSKEKDGHDRASLCIR